MRILHLLPRITEPFEVNRVDGANLVNSVDDLDSLYRLDREQRLERPDFPYCFYKKNVQNFFFHSTRSNLIW